MKNFVLGALVILAGCASAILESYVGKSITEPMLDYGRPTNVFDLGPDRRAFQWQMNTSGVIPMTTPTTSNIYGSGGWATITTNTTTYTPYSQSCLYTLTATRSGDDWIVDGFREPTFMCE
ncbi:hypothetical protein [Yoonia vestfoldensis]|uniref:hypothetical protein n=1 Tax=Yoonia vestfoldensis TaxID=245188 RepID=UPI000B387314|nr:hypothetical protein [Yoonia vestfoldensis]